MKLKPGMRVMVVSGRFGGYLPPETIELFLRDEEGSEAWRNNLGVPLYVMPGSLVETIGVKGTRVWVAWYPGFYNGNELPQ